MFGVCVFFKFLKIWEDKTIHKAFRIHNTLFTKLIRGIFIFIIYQNYTLAL